MNLEYQLNKPSVAFNEIYFDSPQIEILCGSTFGSLCCIKHRNLNLIYFSRLSLILILGDVTKGLRQGDPLSPYLFIIGMDVLSKMFVRAENEKTIQGVRVAKMAPSVSHLSFADDSFIFSEATLSETREVKEILDDYCEISSQLINFSKSAILFSKGACGKRCKAITTLLGVRMMTEN